MNRKNIRTLTNASGFTTKSIGGRDYLIVPGVPVKAQVMKNYLVPANELEFAQMWNGVPITIRHPVQNYGSANVPEPDVAVIGKCYSAVWDNENNRVTAEYWIEIDEAMKYVEGQYILNAIYGNKVLETSTGYWADEELSPGEFEGRGYETIHHNLRPDHIAILVDAIGACSIADGCGVNRNSLFSKLYMNECVQQNGGRGSGDFGHIGRPGQVGGSQPKHVRKEAPSSKSPYKTLTRDVNAYYVTSKAKAKRYKDGFKGATSLMNKSKAENLFNRMTNGGLEPVILEINLKKGAEYSNISSSSITVPKVPGSSVHEITIDDLRNKSGRGFQNNLLIEADCRCVDAHVNEEYESLTKKIEAVHSGFYKKFMQPEESPYIRDIFDDHCTVEYNGEVYNAYYTQGENGEILFADKDSWKKLELVETGDMEDNEETEVHMNVVAADAPKQVKDIFERVYKATLEKISDKARAAKIAWGAVKRAGWKQDEKGAWHKEKGDKKLSKKENAVNSNNNKELTMSKVNLNALLDLIRGKGVDVQVNNEDEFDETTELELPGGEQETVSAQSQQAVAQFTDEEVKGLKALAAMDWAKLNQMIGQMPTVLEMAQNAEAEKTAKKAELVGIILNTQGNMFSKEELEGMTLPTLTKLNSQLTFSYTGLAGAPVFSSNEDEFVALPNISFEKEQ